MIVVMGEVGCGLLGSIVFFYIRLVGIILDGKVSFGKRRYEESGWKGYFSWVYGERLGFCVFIVGL